MDFQTSTIGIVSVLCFFVLPIVATVAWWFIVPTPDGILNWMFWKSVEVERGEEKKIQK